MFRHTGTLVMLLAAVVFLGSALEAASADEAVDKAFGVLKTYDWGQDRAALAAIDKAAAASSGDAAAQKDLQKRLAAVLATDASVAAKDFVCRKLSLVGSADSVPALAKLLGDKDLSHMARYALERISGPKSAAAIRDALPKTSGRLKVGMINSLGIFRDQASTSAVVALLKDSDQQVAAAAAAALGSIGTSKAAKALADFQADAPEKLGPAVADAQLACAERLLGDGKKPEAMKIYMSLAKSDQPKHVKLAATRGLLAAAGKK